MKTPAAAPNPSRLRSIPVRLAVFAAVLVVPILIFLGVLLWQLAAKERARVESDAADTARGLALAIDRDLAGLFASLDVLALSPALQRDDLKGFYDQAAELERRRGLVTVLRSLDGQQLLNLRRPFGAALPSTPFAQADASALRERRPVVSGLFTGAVAEAPLYTVIVPVLRAGTEEAISLLSFSLPVSRVRQLLVDEKPPASWSVSVVDAGDRVVARAARHEEFVGKLATSDLRERTRDGSEGMWHGRTLEGQEVLGAYSRVARADWRVAVGIGYAELNAPLYASLTWLAALGLALAALAAVLAVGFGRRITAPIAALGAQAGLLSRGKAIAPLQGTLVEVEGVSRALPAPGERLPPKAAGRDAADRALKAETERLETLNEIGTRLAAELDLERLVLTTIEAATRLTGAAYGALFEKVPGPDGSAVWRLASLTGAPREAFTRFGEPRATALFGATFAGAEIVRSADVAADPRYGSLGGMPAGHLPVRSYLAVPVLSRSGEAIGALLFGHPEPDRFGEREERLVTGVAGQAAVALDNARLFRSVQREQERFGAAVQAVRGVLWTNDAQGRMSGPQPGWSALTGQSEAARAGYGWAEAVHPEDREATVVSWQAALAARSTFVHEHRVRRHDGIWRTFAIRAVPIEEADGEIREWVGVHTDITEQRAAEAELRESNEEIQRYAYIVSHDLRAPLVNIMGFTSEIEAAREDIRGALGASPEAGRIDLDLVESIGFIKAAIGKMDGLINAILRLSREGRRAFHPVPLAMQEVVQGLADAQRHQADAAGALVEVGPMPGIVADRLAVEQIFGNLIDNALKYRDRARPCRIAVTGAEAGPWIRFAVADNGRGIEVRDHARVFELFRRAGVQDQAGEGIGLAHVRTLVRALGGRIDLASEPGAGTTFTVTLPRAAAAPAAS